MFYIMGVFIIPKIGKHKFIRLLMKTQPLVVWAFFCHEQGMTMVEIAKRNGISERSIYRYKAYYDEMQKKKKGKS